MFPVQVIDGDAVAALARALELSPITARCLMGRGITGKDQARGFLAPRLGALRPPRKLAGLEAAVARIAAAITDGQVIACFGDYDCDGVTSTALWGRALSAMGAREPILRVASRERGYGFTVADAEALADAGAGLIITCDVGTSDVAAIAAARARGIAVVVIDHHTVPAGDPALHPALALINPHRADSGFPFRHMASVGLSFYVAAAVKTRLVEAGWLSPAGTRVAPDIRDLLDLVAIGTIADLMPLCAENRILVAAGLARLRTQPSPGIAALIRGAGKAATRPIDERMVSWTIAPRLNAPGRLGDARPALDLLLASDGEAEAAAEALEKTNDDRRAAQEHVVSEAMAMLEPGDPGPCVVVSGTGWASGVVGIAAAKISEQTGKPACVIAASQETGLGIGSARSAGGINLYEALARCKAHLVRFGGHAGAAGMTVEAAKIPDFRAALSDAVAAQERALGGTDADRAVADAAIALGDVDQRLCDELAMLAPFGQGNPAPVLVATDLTVLKSRRVGDGSHLKLDLVDRAGSVRGAIAFGLGERDPGPGAVIDVLFSPVASTWNGVSRIELEVRDLAPAGAVRAPAATADVREPAAAAFSG